jgi:hypothetical protein
MCSLLLFSTGEDIDEWIGKSEAPHLTQQPKQAGDGIMHGIKKDFVFSCGSIVMVDVYEQII